MVVEFVFNLVMGFVVVVTGSYLGSKMALNTFFGRNFDPSETDRFATTNARTDEKD